MKDAITACDVAIDSGDSTSVPDTALRISADFRDPNIQKLGMVNGDATAIEVRCYSWSIQTKQNLTLLLCRMDLIIRTIHLLAEMVLRQDSTTIPLKAVTITN